MRKRANISRLHRESVKDRIFFITHTRTASPRVRAMLYDTLVEANRQPTVEQRRTYLWQVQEELSAKVEARRHTQIPTNDTGTLPEALRDSYDDVDDFFNKIERFLSGIVWADQDAVMKQREPLRWELALTLDSSVSRKDAKDRELRAFMLRLELEALLQHQDVLVNTARVLYERLLMVAPNLPTLTLAEQDQAGVVAG